ncbi:MAG: SusC/RagA family TonB-linked outer membrane protein [Prevotellaceae bacterium]|jgi:TonB-linked SusC/RagA family outer membrane protein|nr:SusC/RagA family TonB-linked outer membrane protein [Prevotellaceae bacterium]
MKHTLFIVYLSLCALLGIPQQAYAQTVIRFQGTVVDAIGEPIIGATVKIAESSVGTITDVNGQFVLNVPENGKIEVSYIGYSKQVITNLKQTRIVLQEDPKMLDEVVVVGYGSQKMRNVTGAIATLDPKEITDLATLNLGESLSGLIPGLGVSGGGARPGESTRLIIRKADSNAGSDFTNQNVNYSPLYVIDGFISSETDFNNLDPTMVENISVLKDAAAAVYGAASGNGVILVTTKRGRAGAPQISYSGQFGFADAVQHPKMMSAYDQALTWNGVRAAGTSDENPEDIDVIQSYFQADELAAIKGKNYNLLDKYWSPAFTQKHSVNISGGTERTTFHAGISYQTQDGNLTALSYNRWNFSAGIESKITKWVKATIRLSGNYGETVKPVSKVGGSNGENDYNHLLTRPRYIPEYLTTPSGETLPIAVFGTSNTSSSPLDAVQLYHYGAVQSSGDHSQSTPQNMTLNTALEYDFGWSKLFRGLHLRLSYSKAIATAKDNQIATSFTVYRMIDRGGSGTHLYEGEGVSRDMSNFDALSVSNGNLLQRTMSRSDNYQLNFTVDYSRRFGAHDVSAMFGIERSEAETEDMKTVVSDPLSFTDGQTNSALDTDPSQYPKYFGRSESGKLSYIGRLSYSYADKYLLQFLVRSDASTKFAPENYWGVFPSVSAGWVMSEESWFKKHVHGIDFFKVRASFGMLGRDNINPWGWVQLYGRQKNKGNVFGTGTATPGGDYIQSSDAPNRDAHWDTSYQSNLGIDMNLLNNRFSIGLDAFYTWNRDVFMTREGSDNFTSTVGTKPTAENYGAIDAYGVELSLGWHDKIGKNAKYRISINTGYNDNKVKIAPWKALIPIDGAHPNQRTDRGSWGLQCIGMFRSYQEIDEYFDKYQITNYLGLEKSGVHPGMLIYKDIRGAQNADGSYAGPDGKVDRTVDLVQLSNRSNPYGFTVNGSFEYKSFSFSTQIGASWGGYSMMPTDARQIRNVVSSTGGYNDLQYTDLPSFWANNMFVYGDVMDAQGNIIAAQNLTAKYPNLRYKENSYDSTFWRISGTRVAVNRLTVAYTFPRTWSNKLGIGSVRLNLTGQNLLSLYNPYPDHFIDPLSPNYGKYPNLRKFTLGVNVSF